MKERDYYFDNARFILIVLVVAGHIIEPLRQSSNIALKIYTYIYFFHMPAFILISGYFLKNVHDIKSRIIYNLLPTYLIFQFIYCIFWGRSGLNVIVIPCWIMWFLLSLIFWNVMLPLFVKFKHPIIISVVMSIISGYVIQEGGYYFSVMRTFVFFPFFLVGYYLDRRHFALLSSAKVKLASIFVLVIVFVLVINNGLNIDYSWLLGSRSFAEMGHTEWYAGIYRLVIYFISAIMMVSLFSLVPQNQMFISRWGRRTLYVYLLHGIVRRFLEAAGFYDSNLEIGLLIIAIIPLTIFLSSDMICRITKPLVEPKLFIYK